MDYSTLFVSGLKYMRKNFRSLSTEDIEDVIQGAIVRTLKAKSDKKLYFYMCLKSLSIDCLTRNKKVSEKLTPIEDVVFSTKKDFFWEFYFENENLDLLFHTKLLKIIPKLSYCQQVVINAILAGDTIQEIPGNYNTNKNHYSRALKNIQKYLGV